MSAAASLAPAASPVRLGLRRFRRHRTGMVGFALVAAFVALALGAPVAAP
ncbi:MAG: hypothetical protein ACREDY_20725, partial [Bradyrhizobium sp.]